MKGSRFFGGLFLFLSIFKYSYFWAMKKKLLTHFLPLILLFNFYLVSLNGQTRWNVKGIVIDSLTKQPLINASILIVGSNSGYITNIEGAFDFTVTGAVIQLQVAYLGYEKAIVRVSETDDQPLMVLMKPEAVELEGITISSENPDKNVTNIQVGAIQLSAKEIAKLPSLMGEPDLVNSFRTIPGVQSVGEGNPGLIVRGGDAGQNLILLDQMPLYNPSHLLGFFPVFNADIIEHATLIKGAIPANYGGRASSVMDIKMKEGSREQCGGSGSVGLLAADLTLESPLNKGKGSIIISGRRTYLEGIQSLSKIIISDTKNFFNQTSYNFYDVSLKTVYSLTPKTRISVTVFGGTDNYTLTDQEFGVSNNMIWKNWVGAVSLRQVFTDDFSMKLTSGYTRYQFGIKAGFQSYQFDLFSGVNDTYQLLEFNQNLGGKFTIKYGGSFIWHVLTPSKISGTVEDVALNNTNRYYSHEVPLFFQADAVFSEKLSISAGIRGTFYQHLGPYTYYERGISGAISDSTVYEKNQPVIQYWSLDPNISLVYLLNQSASIKASAAVTHQFNHLASVGTVSLPTDIWMPSTRFIKPQRVGMFTSGYFRNFLNNQYETSFELYYKYLDRQVDFLNGLIDNGDNTKIEQNIIEGLGQAFGAEFFVKKREGFFTGSVSYTLSHTIRKFVAFNNGNWYPAKYDRIHDLTLTLNYQKNSRWNFSALWVYATGNALTLPTGRYIIQGNVVNDYGSVNSFRMPAYHRLDVSAAFQMKKFRHWESSLIFSVYNVYNRANPYFIYFRVKGDIDNYYLSVTPRQIALFPILPAITLNFKFY